MRIGINLLYLRPARVGGSEVYVRELIRGLARMPEEEYFIFCSRETAATFAKQEHVTLVEVLTQPFTQARRLFAENWRLRRYVAQTGIDVLFSPANFAAPFLPGPLPQVVTVHDLQHIHLSQYFTVSQRLFRSFMFRASFRKCRAVIAVSEFTRRDLIEKFHLSPDFVSTVREGVDLTVVPNLERRELTRHKFLLPARFFYYPVTCAPHKNHAVLIEAFAKCQHQSGADLQLIFTGRKTALYDNLEHRIGELGLSASVRHLGYVTHNEVLDIMSLSSALVFPSEFEGFGIPLLEAMQCGTPVIASNRSSIPEVTGEAALHLDPHDANLWAEAMTRILSDAPLREGLVSQGLENVQRFSWDTCAEQTLAVLRQSTERI
jgi:glycosyltransferase involved in cell wall biosynthesis